MESNEQLLFDKIGNKQKEAERGQLFGKPCFKVNKKAFVCFFENEMVFKLSGKAHEDALKLKGAQLFDPSGKKRPMKEWVQVPYNHKSKWSSFAKMSLLYVKELSK